LDSIKENYGDLIEESNELGYKTVIVQKELDELSDLYQYAAREAKTLEAAMNYQKVVEDIKDVKKEINNLTYSGIKDFATSIDRVVSAWDTLEKTMNDSESTGWEKFMSVFNLITQVIDSAIGVYQTITTIQELQTKLGAAKIAEQTALNQLLKEEVA
jgi:phage terminase large subunit-like protein